jgi:hypothetical protein
MREFLTTRRARIHPGLTTGGAATPERADAHALCATDRR